MDKFYLLSDSSLPERLPAMCGCDSQNREESANSGVQLSVCD